MSKNNLNNMLVHDLKGPLSEVITNLDILSYTVSKKNMEFVKYAQIGCDTLLEMIHSLLDIAKFKDDKIQLFKEQISLLDLLTEAVSKLYSLLKAHNIKIIINSPSDLQNGMIGNLDKYCVKADKKILLRVLQNLFINAIQYSKSGDKITAGYQSLDNGKFLIYVSDNCPQIPLELQKTIFDKYYSSSNSAGLGLTFCKLAIDAHGGEIFIENNKTKGNIFKFII